MNQSQSSSLMQQATKVMFHTLVESYTINNKEAFEEYLIETWKDLASQSVDVFKGITRLSFMKYYELPLIISQHLFKEFDKDHNDFLSKEEFVNGMKGLFRNDNYDYLSDLIFRLYDDDNDGNISKEDVRMIIGYIQQPRDCLKKKCEGFRNKAIDPEIRSVYQEKIDEIINETFPGKNSQLSKEDYKNTIQSRCSDSFSLLLIFLYDQRPFDPQSLQPYEDRLGHYQPYQPHQSATRELMSPFYKNTSSITSSIVPKAKVKIAKEASKKYVSSSTAKEDVSFYFKPKVYNKKQFTSTESRLMRKSSTAIYNNQFNDQVNNPMLKGGYMFKITKTKKMKVLWFKIINRDMFYYQSRSTKIHKGMHHLTDVFLIPKGRIDYNEANLFSFWIVFKKRTRIYYVEKEEDYIQWTALIEKTIDQRNINDDYEISTNEDNIIKGKYGLIKPAIQLVTQRDVIIKYIEKKTLTKQDTDLVHYEIEVLKMSQQRNVIRLYDLYEDNDYIYYVLEKCNGVDLFSYIEKRNYRLNEKRTCEIIHKMLMSLYYLQSYGIVHRDLKPENIIMTDASDEADIRIIGFNLSKIITKKETCKEPFGTLSYVSPEILTEKPYQVEVDVWSIGIITYLLLSGCLPFDDDHSEREIARQTIHDPVSFKSSLWNMYSNEAKIFVCDLLNKDQTKRIKVDKALVHPWIKKYYPVDVERRMTCLSKDMFKYNTMLSEEIDL